MTIEKPENFKYAMGDFLTKKSGSEWAGFVVGFYQTNQTAEGYAIESSTHRGSVQIYPETALMPYERVTS